MDKRLIDYVNTQRQNGYSVEQIKLALLKAGYPAYEIDELILACEAERYGEIMSFSASKEHEYKPGSSMPFSSSPIAQPVSSQAATAKTERMVVPYTLIALAIILVGILGVFVFEKENFSLFHKSSNNSEANPGNEPGVVDTSGNGVGSEDLPDESGDAGSGSEGQGAGSTDETSTDDSMNAIDTEGVPENMTLDAEGQPAEEGTEGANETGTGIIQGTIINPEWADCAYSIDLMKLGCLAWTTGDKGNCDKINKTSDIGQCLFFVYTKQAMSEGSAEKCSNVPGEGRLLCLAFVESSAIYCINLTDVSLKDTCMFYSEAKAYHEKRDATGCAIFSGMQKELCTAVLEDNTAICEQNINYSGCPQQYLS
jgi:hypothetical protein